MFQKFLIPLDGSKEAERVLPLVTALGMPLKPEIVLLDVVDETPEDEPRRPVLTKYDAVLAEFEETRKKLAADYLEQAARSLGDSGTSVATDVEVGAPAYQILQAAARHQSDLIVMATHGRVGPQRWFLGSVADRVARTSDVPVLLVRPADEGNAGPALRTIIVPLDGSSEAEQALPYASFLATSFGVPISLVRCEPLTWAMSAAAADPSGIASIPPELIEEIQRDAVDYLNKTVQRLRDQGITAEAHFGKLNPAADEIVRVAESTPGAVVVMTTHGRSGIGRALFGSVADKVVRSSGAPVLIVRPRA